MRVKLEKGSGVINFSIPDNMIIDTLTGKDIPALSHEQGYLFQSVYQLSYYQELKN